MVKMLSMLFQTLLATPLETQFAQNTQLIFWGSELAVGIVMFSLFIAAVALTRIPMLIVAPLYMMGLLIFTVMFPAFTLVTVIVLGLIICSLVYSFWKPNR